MTGSPWSFSGGAGISANNSLFHQRQPIGPLKGAEACHVLQQTGSFSQSVSGWAAGSYQITFQAAQRGNNNPPSQQNFSVLVDGNSVGTFTPWGASYQTYTTAPFPVAAGSHTITFQGLGSAGGDKHQPSSTVLTVTSTMTSSR